MGNENDSQVMLRSITDRLINVERQIRDLKEDQKDIRAEAKSHGFDVSALNKVVKDYFKSDMQKAREEEIEAISDVYKANLGMLGGTPLGEAARSRLNAMSKPKHAPAQQPDDADDTAPAPELEPEQTINAEDIHAAKQRGRDDALAGKKILDNPYVSGDPRRAAWDAGWCESMDSDGMDIPDAWKPKKKPKKGDEPEDGKGGEG